MRIELIETEEALRALEPTWEALWSSDLAADIFASFPWFLNWWEHFGHGAGPAALVVHQGDELVPVAGRGAQLHVLVVHDHGEPVAILPLILVKGWWQRCPVRILAPPLNAHAPRSGFLPSQLPECAIAAVVEHLATSRRWDLLLLDGIPCASGFVRALCQVAATRGLRGSTDSSWTHSCLSLEGTWEHYLARQGGHFRKHLRQAQRALEKLGPLTVERYEGPARVSAGMRLLFEIDGESWKASDGESVALHPSLEAYYRDLAMKLARRDRCEVWVLRIGAESGAAVLCLRDQQVLYILKSSYKDRFGSARYSPSLVLIAYILQAAWERKYASVDFVGRTPFLERWTSGSLEFDRLILFRRKTLELFVRLFDRAADLSARIQLGLRARRGRPVMEVQAAREGSGGASRHPR